MAMISDKLDMNDPLCRAAGRSAIEPPEMPSIKSLEEMERAYIEMIILRCEGSIPCAARLLKVSPSTIYRKQARWGK